MVMPTPKTIVKNRELMPVSICAASDIPVRSAPIVATFAQRSAAAAIAGTQRGYFCRNAPARPRPVSIPTRAVVNKTNPISGHMNSGAQRTDVPNCAPAMEYVAMPDGSLSAVPAVNPGPRTERKLLSGLVLAEPAGVLARARAAIGSDCARSPRVPAALSTICGRADQSVFTASRRSLMRLCAALISTY